MRFLRPPGLQWARAAAAKRSFVMAGGEAAEGTARNSGLSDQPSPEEPSPTGPRTSGDGQRSVSVDLLLDAFLLETGKERLDDSIVPAVPLSAHAP